MAGGTERMVIRIPASPTFLRAAQMAASGLAAQLDFTYDRVSDLRLAVAEACWLLTDQLPVGSAQGVELCFLVDDPKLAVEVRLRPRREQPSGVLLHPTDPDAALRLALLQGLVDEACVICDARKGTCVRLNCFRPRGACNNGAR